MCVNDKQSTETYQFNANDKRWFNRCEMNDGHFRFGTFFGIFVHVDTQLDLFRINIAKT